MKSSDMSNVYGKHANNILSEWLQLDREIKKW